MGERSKRAVSPVLANLFELLIALEKFRCGYAAFLKIRPQAGPGEPPPAALGAEPPDNAMDLDVSSVESVRTLKALGRVVCLVSDLQRLDGDERTNLCEPVAFQLSKLDSPLADALFELVNSVRYHS